MGLKSMTTEQKRLVTGEDDERCHDDDTDGELSFECGDEDERVA
jgi:hypothetical protein